MISIDESLILPENYPELVNMFLGDEIYLIEEVRWYKDIPHEGGNKYRFLNIVNLPEQTGFFSEKGRDFFFRMCSSIKTERISMDADGFAVVNAMQLRGLTWENLTQKFSPKYCIFWGIDPSVLKIPCKIFGGAIKDECRISYVPSMEDISEDKEMKAQLWRIVQRMFGMVNSK